ncbi:MAG: type VI secretion system baseplate subunit TssF [Geobacteraceae bacterium]|nr:type VI secretion system baseplate subunit TssF [Geobacteraceae bacterium]
MTKNSFHLELSRLRELAAGFADANPALAPLLNGSMTDPDVERLLDAVAFHNDLLERKLRVEFPKLIHQLADIILPHYLRPIPATTVIGFTPKPNQEQSVTIPAGSQLSSAPVNGTPCCFTTTVDLEIHPLELRDVAIIQASGRNAEIRLSLTSSAQSLSHWQPRSLRLFLAGDRASATELYQLLRLHVTRIVVTPSDGGAGVTLPPECLKPEGFDDCEVLFPYPLQAFLGYRLIQEYFHLPEKFLFFELSGSDRWLHRGEGKQFTVSFELDDVPSVLPRIGQGSFVLHAVPAINIFPHDADPIQINHHASRYRIRPSGSASAHYRILSVDRIRGYCRDSCRERTYVPFDLFSLDTIEAPVYYTSRERSQGRDDFDTHISVAFPTGVPFPDKETLSISLTCTNGTLPESLRIGDICVPSPTIPESLTFRNITPVNPGYPPFLGPDLLWRLTCHLYLNHVSLGSVEHLRTLLQLYVPHGGPESANLKRISGIEEIQVLPSECRVAGDILRGSEFRMAVRQDHFAGPGDLYLFGCVIDRFLVDYASINSYTKLVMGEVLKGESYQWPIRQV